MEAFDLVTFKEILKDLRGGAWDYLGDKSAGRGNGTCKGPGAGTARRWLWLEWSEGRLGRRR